MTAESTTHGEDRSSCWCCGRDKPESRLLRLGARPEAAVCLDCVPQLRHRARVQEDPPVLVRHLHTGAGRLRKAVMATGIHQRPIIGSVLRRLNRRSPF